MVSFYMRLNNSELSNRAQWEKVGIILPEFDREAMIAATMAAPEWVHFGAGNIFRIYIAALQQTLLEQGIEKKGIIMVAGRDGEIIDKVFSPCDNLTLGVTLKANGAIEKKIIASIAKALWMGNNKDFEELKNIFCSPSLKTVSFTVTEKAYLANDYFAKITELLLERFRSGSFPLALLSMDNCSRNGEKLFKVVESFAGNWVAKGIAESGFLDFIRDRNLVSFPCSMIDKITPGPDRGVKAMLEKDGFLSTEIYSKTTPTAPFVNAEEPQYLVIEDCFPNGRQPLEKTGVFFTTRETVEKAERMKVSTCLNPLHTALAIFGCLLGYSRISDEMQNQDLVRLVEGIGYREGLPVVCDPGIINPGEFIDTVIRKRLPNPFIPDTPQRIATDSSQKIPIRFGETIKAYLSSNSLKAENLVFIPLVFAGWLRYLLGVDDEGNPFTVSPDPLYESLSENLSGLKLGQTESISGKIHDKLKPVLSNPALCGVNLYEAGLGEKVEHYFEEMIMDKGAVKKTLKKYTA
jgi:fructuronate reductase